MDFEKMSGTFVEEQLEGLNKESYSKEVNEGEVLVIAPPSIQKEWKETFEKFEIGTLRHYDILSLGKLESIRDTEKYSLVIIDESHKFKNYATSRYAELERICKERVKYKKKVILISATPLNNKPMDIANQLYLFQDKRNSTIASHPNLESFFTKIDKEYKEIIAPSKDDKPIDIVKLKALSLRVGESILREVMVRRTRTDIQTHDIWYKILHKEYEVIAINFGSNKEIKLKKSYKYPTVLKYIKIEERYYSLAFLPNIWGDLELTTIFPIRYKEIKIKLKKIVKPLAEINVDNFVFNNEVYQKVEELQEDCRPLHQGAELPQQAVVQKGLSTFYNSFTLASLADNDLKGLLKDKDYYQKTINKLLNSSTLTQHKLKDIMLKKLKDIKVLDPAIGSGAFPMGVLHELVDLRRHLGDKTDLATLKKDIIENSIYGIDIEPSAVEIAKLRFWLSIVVDEDTPTPLPNLFYKIMVGNSLLETVNGFDPLGKQDQDLFGDSYQIGMLQEKFHSYYKVWDNDKKREIQVEIDDIIDEVLDSKLREHEEEIQSYVRNADIFSFDKKATKQLELAHDKINLLTKVKQKPTTELFFYKLYFAEVMNRGGFNVVIGNPPYIKEYTNKSAFERMSSIMHTSSMLLTFIVHYVILLLTYSFHLFTMCQRRSASK